MACVWAARLLGERGFSKLVAVKTILPHLAHNPDFEKMLVDEARIAANVHHPNVCDLYELGEQDQVLYLAMEWVNGDSLLHILRSNGGTAVRGLDSRVAARIVADACAGLHAAHELTDDFGRALCVVHRDVSPHNILVSIDGAVKVADFGVAKAGGQLHQTTNPGEVKGKAAYMAPEQIAGPSVDRRADIFGLGCVLYEATMGKRPFRADQESNLLRDVLRGSYEAPNFAFAHASELKAIVERALAPRPEDRFQTADEMRVALEDWLVATGPMVAGAHVADVLKDRLGPQIEERRERVRQAMCETAGPTRPVQRPQPDGGIIDATPVQSVPVLPPPRPPPRVSEPVRLGPQSASTGRRGWLQTVAGKRGWVAAAGSALVAVVVGRAVIGSLRSGPSPRVEVTVEPPGRLSQSLRVDSKAAVLPAIDLAIPMTPVTVSPSQLPPAVAPPRAATPAERLPARKSGAVPLTVSAHPMPVRPQTHPDEIPANPY
jgi:serine/threonine-protein kinase